MYILSCGKRRVSQFNRTALIEFLTKQQHALRHAEFSWQPDVVVRVKPGPMGLELKPDTTLNAPTIVSFKAVSAEGDRGYIEKSGSVVPGFSLLCIGVGHSSDVDRAHVDILHGNIDDEKQRYSTALDFLRAQAKEPKLLVFRCVVPNPALKELKVPLPSSAQRAGQALANMEAAMTYDFYEDAEDDDDDDDDDDDEDDDGDDDEEEKQKARAKAKAEAEARAKAKAAAEAKAKAKAEAEAKARAEAEAKAKAEAEARAREEEARKNRMPFDPTSTPLVAAATRTHDTSDASLAISALHSKLLATRLLFLGTDRSVIREKATRCHFHLQLNVVFCTVCFVCALQ